MLVFIKNEARPKVQLCCHVVSKRNSALGWFCNEQNKGQGVTLAWLTDGNERSAGLALCGGPFQLLPRTDALSKLLTTGLLLGVIEHGEVWKVERAGCPYALKKTTEHSELHGYLLLKNLPYQVFVRPYAR